jgi:S-adenosylmethionine hydrolase
MRSEVLGPTIALITDFGIEDSYVGIMKGVMRKICPTADFIDISHSITRQNAREAALTLMNAYRYFPAGTIFLVVVDPGVGSERRPVAVSGDEYFFVAPDNGVLSYTLAELELLQAVSLSKEEYHLELVSQTFHGRDIFSPAAAHLAAGIALSELGEAIEDLQRLPAPELRLLKDRLLGEVTHIDHFGNVVTSIGELIRAGKNTIRLKPR